MRTIPSSADGQHDSRPTPGQSTTDPVAAGQAWDTVVALFEDAATDPGIAERVGRAGVALHLRAVDLGPDAAVVIDMRGRMEVCDASSDHDVELELATPDLQLLAKGTLRTAMAIAAGRAVYRGPIREVLRVLPMIQALGRPPITPTRTDDGATA